MEQSNTIENKKLNMCVICLKQIYQATSLSMCLHTFCWKCIYGKITYYNRKYCPVCYANLGENPLEQLRPNHILESLKSINFSPNQEEVQTETGIESERTLTDSESKTETDSERTLTDSETETEPDRTVTYSHMESKTFETLSPTSTNMEVTKPFIGESNIETGDSNGKVDLPVVSDLGKIVNADSSEATSSSAEKRGKSKVVARVIEDTTSPAPIWFTLFASNHQDSNAPLPQIPPCYLRVKNRNLQVSYIKKYIAVKLNLESEDEVELYLRNQRLDSSMMLHNLLDYWIRTTPDAERISPQVGSSGAEIVMVLCYTRKSQPVH